ncbi:hypothetical protein EYF80_021370 [Liparis tanakae]|uniref:Uncharacterized protein n=1 Tax=Liparis tanakae TaxID=230148 RepID=A0A4Z2HRI4_9TELE|nr:hypothetical protein EYF80_021370 [Liparis tanakae]
MKSSQADGYMSLAESSRMGQMKWSSSSLADSLREEARGPGGRWLGALCWTWGLLTLPSSSMLNIMSSSMMSDVLLTRQEESESGPREQ